MNIAFISLFFLFSNTNQIAIKVETKLQTGWYYIIDEDKGTKRQLDKTENYYFLDPSPIVTAKNIKEIKFRLDNEQKAFLAIQFDAPGTKAWSMATLRSINRRLGFVLNDKLIQAPLVNSEITGGVSAIWDYSRPELETIKKEIEKNKSEYKAK
jgi:preprotein translocase subunit SecD